MSPHLWLAVHETGHGVSHLVLAERWAALGQARESYLISVTIEPPRRGNVRVRLRKQHDVRDRAMTCLAGFAAENRFTEGPDWQPTAADFANHMHLRDIRMAADEVAGLDDPAAEMMRAWQHAHAIVTAEWSAILRVAGLLAERLTLSAAEFESGWRIARFA